MGWPLKVGGTTGECEGSLGSRRGYCGVEGLLEGILLGSRR